ncbi:MAG: hypothetical protein ABF337_06875, partial [Akkermansiaceae bacterium]
TEWLRNQHPEAGRVAAIFNQTSGRLVAKAVPEDHVTYFESRWDEINFQLRIAQRVEIYEFPGNQISCAQRNPKKLPNGARKLLEMTNFVEEGSLTKCSVAGLIWESESHFEDRWDEVTTTFNLSGGIMVDDHSYEVRLKHTLTGRDGFPKCYEIGGVRGRDKTLVMRLTNSCQFLDGFSFIESIMDENDEGPFLTRRESQFERFSDVRRMSEDGKEFACYTVPLSIVEFLAHNDEADDDDAERYDTDDPFADPDADVNTEDDRFNIEYDEVRKTRQRKLLRLLRTFEVDPRIDRKKRDRLYNLKTLFEASGVRFGKEDFAVFNESQGRLSVSLPCAQADLIYSIVRASDLDELDRSLYVSEFRLLESEQRISLENVELGNVKTLGVCYAHALPGENWKLSLGFDNEQVSVESVTNSSRNHGLIEQRFAVSFSKDKEEFFKMTKDVTLRVGKPLLIHEYLADGKWRALLVQCMLRKLAETPP